MKYTVRSILQVLSISTISLCSVFQPFTTDLHAEEFKTFEEFHQKQTELVAQWSGRLNDFETTLNRLEVLESALSTSAIERIRTWNQFVELSNQITILERDLREGNLDTDTQYRVLPNLQQERGAAIIRAGEAKEAFDASEKEVQEANFELHSAKQDMNRIESEMFTNIAGNYIRFIPKHLERLTVRLNKPDETNRLILDNRWAPTNAEQKLFDELELLENIINDAHSTIGKLLYKQGGLATELVKANDEWQALHEIGEDILNKEAVTRTLFDVGSFLRNARATGVAGFPIVFLVEGVYRFPNFYSAVTSGHVDKTIQEISLPEEFLSYRAQLSLGGENAREPMSSIDKIRLRDAYEGTFANSLSNSTKDAATSTAESLARTTLANMLNMLKTSPEPRIFSELGYFGLYNLLFNTPNATNLTAPELAGYFTGEGRERLAAATRLESVINSTQVSYSKRAIDSMKSLVPIKQLQGLAISFGINLAKEEALDALEYERLEIEFEKYLAELRWFIIRNERRGIHDQIATSLELIKSAIELSGQLIGTAYSKSAEQRQLVKNESVFTSLTYEDLMDGELVVNAYFTQPASDVTVSTASLQREATPPQHLEYCERVSGLYCSVVKFPGSEIVERAAGQMMFFVFRQNPDSFSDLDANPATVAGPTYDGRGIPTGFINIEPGTDSSHKIFIGLPKEDADSGSFEAPTGSLDQFYRKLAEIHRSILENAKFSKKLFNTSQLRESLGTEFPKRVAWADTIIQKAEQAQTMMLDEFGVLPADQFVTRAIRRLVPRTGEELMADIWQLELTQTADLAKLLEEKNKAKTKELSHTKNTTEATEVQLRGIERLFRTMLLRDYNNAGDFLMTRREQYIGYYCWLLKAASILNNEMSESIRTNLYSQFARLANKPASLHKRIFGYFSGSSSAMERHFGSSFNIIVSPEFDRESPSVWHFLTYTEVPLVEKYCEMWSEEEASKLGIPEYMEKAE